MNFPYLIYSVDPNGNISQPANEGDVGCDVVADSDPVIVGIKEEYSRDGYKSIDYIEYDLNIKLDGFQPQESPNDDVYTLVFPRSSVSKYNLVLANSIGLIDSGYRATLKVRFKYIFQPEDFRTNGYGSFYALVDYDKIYKKGDKICQLVFQKHFHPLLGYSSELEQSQRNQGGFGSTTPNQ
jgi:dUTPase